MKSTVEVLAILSPTLLIIACSEQNPDQATDAGNAADVVQCERPLDVPEDCREAACKMASCGTAFSHLDEHLCERARCERQEDCLPEEECLEVHYRPPQCGYFEDPSRCSCGAVLMDFHDWFCMPKP